VYYPIELIVGFIRLHLGYLFTRTKQTPDRHVPVLFNCLLGARALYQSAWLNCSCRLTRDQRQ